MQQDTTDLLTHHRDGIERDLSIRRVLKYFSFEHLPEHLQETSEIFFNLAVDLAEFHPTAFHVDRVLSLRAEAIRSAASQNNLQHWQTERAGEKLQTAAKMLIDGLHVSLVLELVLEAKDCAVRAAVP